MAVEDEISESELTRQALQSRPEDSGPPLRTHWLLPVGVVVLVVVILASSKPSARVMTRVWAPGGRASAILVEIKHPSRAPAYQVCVFPVPPVNSSLLPCTPVAGFGALTDPALVKFVWRSSIELEIHYPRGTEGHSYVPVVPRAALRSRLGVLTRMVED